MFFNFVRPKIVVDAFTDKDNINTVAPITSAAERLPSWWRDLPKQYPHENSFVQGINHPTIRRCPAVTKVFTNGLVIPLWADIIIETGADGGIRWQWSDYIRVSDDDTANGIGHHPVEQYGPNFSDLIHLKLISPCVLKEKTGVDFYFTAPYWSNTDLMRSSIHICPGIINYKYTSATHVNMFMPKRDCRTTMRCGDPTVLLIPMTDKEVIVKTHVISQSEHRAMALRTVFKNSFFNNYSRRVKAENL